jgi:hypothetical protein
MSLTKRWMESQAEETPATRLERARRSVQSALRAAADGQADVLTLCRIEHALNAALREMDRLQLTLAVMERQHERMAS